jgi:hypothetical protein
MFQRQFIGVQLAAELLHGMAKFILKELYYSVVVTCFSTNDVFFCTLKFIFQSNLLVLVFDRILVHCVDTFSFHKFINTYQSILS